MPYKRIYMYNCDCMPIYLCTEIPSHLSTCIPYYHMYTCIPVFLYTFGYTPVYMYKCYGSLVCVYRIQVKLLLHTYITAASRPQKFLSGPFWPHLWANSGPSRRRFG